MYTKLLIFIIPALLTACGSSKNKVKDDWPGIDDSSFRLKNNVSSLSNKADTFSLTTEMLLPKMGKDVSYTVTSTCTRKYPTDYKGEKTPYTKSIKYPASANENLKPLQVFEHLPEEMIIFPEHFSTCDFTLDTENQNKSIDSAVLKDQAFQNLSDEHTISLTKRNFQDNTTPSLRTKLDDFTLESIDRKRMEIFETVCYSNKISITKTELLSHAVLKASNLTLPEETEDFPLEYCRVRALSLKSGKILFSPILKIINRELQPKVKQYDIAQITTSLNPTAIPYNSSNFLNLKPLFTIEFTNTSTTDNLNVKIHTEDSVEKIYIINSLKKVSDSKNGYNHIVKYSPNLIPIDSYSAWTVPETGNTTSSIRLAPGKRKGLDFKTFPSYNCSNNNEELGFIIAPERKNPLFTYSLMNHNEFVSEAFYTGGILFDTDANDGAGGSIEINNIPDHATEALDNLSNSEFMLYFRNQNVQAGRDIQFSITTFEPEVQSNGEYGRVNELKMAKNPRFLFSRYVNQNDQTQCHSYDTIQTDGTSPDGDIILQPLGSRSVDL